MKGSITNTLNVDVGVRPFKVKYKKLKDKAKVPTFGTPDSAGADLYACIDDGRVVIPPGETKVIGTGIAIEPPKGYFGAVFARSGLSVKEGLRPANCVGVCDQDFRGEYCVALHNDSDEWREVESGDRIAQVVFLPYLTQVMFVEEELSDTERGNNMLGSTGKK